jgi:hypothetical protein
VCLEDEPTLFCMRVSVCVRERSMKEKVCVCVCERERGLEEKLCMCVCARVYKRERED